MGADQPRSRTLRDRALEAIERYRAEHPDASLREASERLAGELGSTPGSVLEAYYQAARRRAADGNGNGSSRSSGNGNGASSSAKSREDAVIEILLLAAIEIDAHPGTNVLDALNAAHRELGIPDERRADAYYALLRYLPAHVEYLGPWSDRETPEIVANKLRACARTIQRGGPAVVPADPRLPADLAAVRSSRSGL